MAKKKTSPKRATAKKTRRRTRTVNKSQAVRDYMASNPDAKPKEIAESLSKKGIKVTPQAVSTIKFNAAKKAPTTNGRRTKAGRRSGAVNVDALVEAKKLADKLGGVGPAKQALDVLAKLQ